MLNPILTFKMSSLALFEIFVFCVFGVVAVFLTYRENSIQEVLKKYINIILAYIYKIIISGIMHMTKYIKKLLK